MDRPGELIRRAAQKAVHLPGMEGARLMQPVQEAPPELPAPVPQPVSRHGSYTALMRSHDRVHTRHIRG